MSVPVIENWADLTGIIRSVDKSSRREGFSVVNLLVKAVDDVAGFPNLFDKEAIIGAVIPIHFPSKVMSDPTVDLTTGRRIRCRVRRATRDLSFVNIEHVANLPGR